MLEFIPKKNIYIFFLIKAQVEAYKMFSYWKFSLIFLIRHQDNGFTIHFIMSEMCQKYERSTTNTSD